MTCRFLPPYRPGGQPAQPAGTFLSVDDRRALLARQPSVTGVLSRIFDWRRDCPEDLARRRWPAVVGRGRGVLYEPPA